MPSKWDKPSEELQKLLETVLFPYDCTFRRMFGSVTYFVNNNMFSGVHEDTIFLRLSEKDRELLREEHPDSVNFEPLEGRKMREYMVLSESVCRNIPLLEKWIEKSYLFVNSLPPKQPKKKK